MPPTIKVGLVGLAAEINTEGYRNGQWGVQHLNAIVASPRYQVVAVCNSTVESASRAIAVHNLGPNVKAYGSAEDIAGDPAVELVVISVHVNKHFSLAAPAIAHKKDIYLEFPVAPSISDVEELAKLAKEAGIKAVIGAQAVAEPSLKRLKELIKSQAIGDVVISTFVGHLPVMTAHGFLDQLKGFLDVDSGISRINICLGHALAAYIAALGEMDAVQSIYKIHEKTARIVDDSNNTVDPAYKVTSPDTMLVQGIHASGATSSFSLRTSPSPVEDVGFRWLVSGTLGEVELTTKPGPIQMGGSSSLRLRKFGEEAEDVEFGKGEPEYIETTPAAARNIARVYEAFATGDEEGYVTIADALKVHRLLDQVTKAAQWAP